MKILVICILMLSQMASEPILAKPISDKFHIAATSSKGIYNIQKVKPASMSPGYTMAWVHHGSEISWFKGARVVFSMNVPGSISVVRDNGEDGIYGIFDHRPIAIAWNGEVVFKSKHSCHHDIIKTERGTYLCMQQYMVNDTSKNDLIIEIDAITDEIIWSLDVNTLMCGTPDCAQNLGGRGENWMHTNSLDLFSNGDLLVSTRNYNALVRVSYPMGIIENTWGLGKNVLGLQHHGTVLEDKGVVMAFDNGFWQEESGIIQFDINPPYGVVFDKRLGFFSKALGSVEKLANGNWLVTQTKDPARIIEYSEDFSEIYLDIRVVETAYAGYRVAKNQSQAAIYRVHRVESLPPWDNLPKETKAFLRK